MAIPIMIKGIAVPRTLAKYLSLYKTVNISNKDNPIFDITLIKDTLRKLTYLYDKLL